jgi:hypothetical protein
MGWCSATKIFDDVVGELLKKEKSDSLKELAWLYQKYSEVISSLPVSVEDFIDERPTWSKARLGTLMERANKAVENILSDKPDDSIKETIKRLIESLEDGDWDCQQDSAYYDHPIVRKAFMELHPDWFEEEDE